MPNKVRHRYLRPCGTFGECAPTLAGADRGRGRYRYRGRKGIGIAFGHEKLDVYRAAIEYAGWGYRYCEALDGHRNATEQLMRASQAIPLNIAEGNGKGTDGDRRRYFEIARGSALECGAVQDVL